MSGRGGKREGKLFIEGRLLPVKEDGEEIGGDEDVDLDDQADPEFLDAEEIEEGAVQIPSFSPQKTTVNILANGSEEYTVTGFFPMTDPWWSVRVNVKQSGSRYFVNGYPSYKLEDNILENKSILSLFLKECKVHEDHRLEFMSWVEQHPPVTLRRLIKLAEIFKKKTNMDIVPYLKNSACYTFALKALEIPLVLRYLPKLLPRKMRSLLKLHNKDRLSVINTASDNSPPDVLFKLQCILDTEPWKLGFGSLLYSDLRLSGCEATLENILQCDDNFLQKIPELQLHALYIYSELKKTCMRWGDTYVTQSALINMASKLVQIVDPNAAIEFLEQKNIVVTEQKRVFKYNYYKYEENIADFLTMLVMKKLQNPKVKEKDILSGDHTSQREAKVSCSGNQTLVYELSDEQIKNLLIDDCTTEENRVTELDAEQQIAARMILANPVTIISGKGGCGKTTVVSRVFRAVMGKEKEKVEKARKTLIDDMDASEKNEVESACNALEDDMDASEEWDFNVTTSSTKPSDPARILFTAPTGKAASLLRKKTELPAATLHQITCSYSAWKNRQRKSDEEHTYPWKFSQVEVLVVDEGSLVSIQIFSAVLKLLCTKARLAKLVILGDIRQLPSIEPGNVLADVYGAFQEMNWAIELKTNHRAESRLIVDNATCISKQQPLKFDAELHFDRHKKPDEMPSEEKKFILVSLAAEHDLSTAIEALIKDGPGLKCDKLSQFIAFRRKDCLLINDLCCKHYSGHRIKDSRNRFDFRFNDKVCCTKNAYVKDLQTTSRLQCADQNTADRMTQSEVKWGDDERICNGEIFYITDDVEKDKIRELTLFDNDERTYTLNYKALISLSGLRHSWARTIHTFQGSEEDTVVFVLGNASYQNWKHVYTAVTRGRKRVYIIAKKDELNIAITKKYYERKTRLQQCLKKSLLNSGAWPQSGTSASINPVKTQVTQDKPALVSQEHLYTQLKSSVPTTPDVTSSRKGCDDGVYSAGPTLLAPLGSSMNHEKRILEESGIPDYDMGTPPKQCRLDNPMNFPEASPSSRLQDLSLDVSCSKRLFDQ